MTVLNILMMRFGTRNVYLNMATKTLLNYSKIVQIRESCDINCSLVGTCRL